MPKPRLPTALEKTFTTVLPDGTVSGLIPMPSWVDQHYALREMGRQGLIPPSETFQVDAGECYMSLVVPAFNEEQRLKAMLEEAVDYLQKSYGHTGTKKGDVGVGTTPAKGQKVDAKQGWEVIIVSDGSTDQTVQVALDFAKAHHSRKGVTTKKATTGVGASNGTIRVVRLEQNRGKGGAVTHGMRHARGAYVVFADADGASRFTDLGKLVAGCEQAQDEQGRAVSIGSRAHMVGTEAVVQVV